MKNNNQKLLHELVNFVAEQRKINLVQKQINHRLENFVAEQRKINLVQKQINHRLENFVQEQRDLNLIMARKFEQNEKNFQKFREDSERRFRVFYDRLVKLEQKHF